MLALREIQRRKLQFGLITGVVTLVSYLVIMVTGLGLGLNELAGTALLNLRGDAIVFGSGADRSVVRSQLAREVVAEVSALPGVEAAAPIGYAAAALQYGDGEVETAAMLGFVPGTIAEPPVVAGRALTAADTRALLVDRGFVDLTGVDVGDTVLVPMRLRLVEFTVVGLIDEGSFFFQPAIYLVADAFAELAYGTVDEETPVANIVLLRGDGLAGRSGEGWEAVDKDTAFSNIEGVQAQQSTVDALRYMGLLIGALVVGMFFYVVTLQKVAQLGMLKALGASSALLLRQGLAQVVAVAIAGALLAVLAALATDRFLIGESAVPIRFTTGALVSTGVAVVAASLVGTLLSARQVTAVDPIVAMAQQQ